MNAWEPVRIDCPYCGEPIDIAIERSAGRQQYVEDCHVCCQPIHLRVAVDEDGQPRIDARRDDE